MNSKANSKFFSFFKFIAVLVFCFAVSGVVIFPLWAFASNAPRAYSSVVLIFAAISIGWKLVRAAKKAGAKKFFLFLLKFLIMTTGICVCFYFLFTFRRLFALVSLAVAIALFGLVSKSGYNQAT